MLFFSSKRGFFNELVPDLTLNRIALGYSCYLPYTNFTEGYATKINQYNCYSYLGLLARFINFTKDLSEHELKIYLVRAEYRYFKFMNFVHDDGLLSLDAAIFMQAHKAHPHQFEDDCNRDTSGSFHTHFGLNLEQIVEYSESTAVLSWDTKMQYKEPYLLTNDNLMTGFAEITCVVCFINIEIKWEDYAEWRTDTVALQCNHCKTVFTRNHIGKTNLILDLRKSMANDDPSTIKSTMGKLHLKIMKHIRSDHDIQALPFNSGLAAIKDYLKKNQEEAGLEDDGSIDEFIETAKQSYFQSPYIGSSFDLLKAVAEQYEFLYKVTQSIQWKRSDFLRMIDNYEYFLELSKQTSNLLVPDLRADIARHVHMTNATFYREITLKLCERILDHNTAIPQESELEYAKRTQREWNLSIAKHTQNKTIAAIGSIVNGIAGENKIQIPASESVRQCHKYNTDEASYYQKDGFTRFDNMRFMLDYLTKRIELLDNVEAEWVLSDETKVIQTNGGVPELTVKQIKPSSYYPFTADNPSFNWRDANKAWSKAFKDVRDYKSTSTRLFKNKSFIGSMLIDFEIIFSNEVAFKKREIQERMRVIKNARKLNNNGQERYKNTTNRGHSLTLGVQSSGFGQDVFYNAYNDYSLYEGCHTTYDASGSSSGCNDSGGGSSGGGGGGGDIQSSC